jgi:hypothetical protein
MINIWNDVLHITCCVLFIGIPVITILWYSIKSKPMAYYEDTYQRPKSLYKLK